jgi:hypothetical protein
MKKYIKLFLLTVFALLAIVSAFAQARQAPTEAMKKIYQDPKVKQAIDFMIMDLPGLAKTDRTRAIAEYEKHFAELNKLNEQDVLFLVAHFYSVVDDAKTAIPYFEILVTDPRLGEDSRRMLQLLIYQRTVANLLAEDKLAGQNHIRSVLEAFDTGKYYPTYLYLWADLVADGGDFQEVNEYVTNYEQNKLWVASQFRPRKQAIIARLENLNLESYYQNPVDKEYQKLEIEINNIQKDLETLYNEAQTMRGLVLNESLNKLYQQESAILKSLKDNLKGYKDPPPVDFSALATSDSTALGVSAYEKYREGAMLVQELRFSADYYGQVVALMEQVFDTRYEMFVNEDPAILGRDFSDMEMKRLFDIERNIETYQEMIDTIQEVMQTEEYKKQTAMDLAPQLKEYQEKKQDLMIRKQTYLSMHKHESEVEEMAFNELIEEYYALNRDKLMLEETLDMVEDEIVAMMMTQYPEDVKEIIQKQQDIAFTEVPALKDFDESVEIISTNLEYISLQNKYRELSFRERKRRASDKSYEELATELSSINAEKNQLLNSYINFLSKNPNLPTMEQPSGGYLVSLADVYYNMGELAYATNLDDPMVALRYYKRALDSDANFYLKDHVQYNIGYISGEYNKSVKGDKINEYRAQYPGSNRTAEYRFQESDFAEAIEAYGDIKTNFAGSTFYEESLYRLGIIYFLIGTDAERPIDWYNMANAEFDKLIEGSQSRYSYEALYQRGFVKMNIGTDEALNSALDDFAQIVRAVDANKIEDKIVAEDLKTTALDNVSYCLIALDGSDQISQAKGLAALERVFGDYQDEAVMARILDKAAQDKKGMLSTLQAIDFLELRINKTPRALENPSLVDTLLMMYHTPNLALREGMNLEDIKRGKYQWAVNSFSQNSPWYATNVKDKDINDPNLKQQLESVRTAYEQTMAVRFNQVLADYNDESYAAYSDLVQKYSAYRELFPDDYDSWKKSVAKDDLLLIGKLAETRKTNQAYFTANQRLLAYNTEYPDLGSADYLDNEKRAFQFAENIYDNMKGKYTPGFTPEEGLPANQDALDEYFANAVERYYGVLTTTYGTDVENQRVANSIYLKLANIEFEKGQNDKARQRYLALLNSEANLTNNHKYNIYLNLAYIAEREKDYSLAEQQFRQAYGYASSQEDKDLIDSLVKVQIQSAFQQAEAGGDYTAAATGYARLAEEFKNDPAKYLEYKGAEANSYIKAKNYNKAIESYTNLANLKTNPSEAYVYYYLAWNTADSLMMDPQRAQIIKSEFMGKYPSSNETYKLKVTEIEKLAATPAQRDAAAQQYIALSNDVRQDKIDSGGIAPESIYLQAVGIYEEDKNTVMKLQSVDEFVRIYPDYKDNKTLLEGLAIEYLALGDTTRFDAYARQLFLSDKTNSLLYLEVAERDLNKILVEYDEAYENQQWAVMLAKIAEFKSVEKRYKDEGLVMDHKKAYDSFAATTDEYNKLQAKLDFLKRFDAAIAAVQNGDFMKLTPNQLMSVSAKTSWRNNLIGGKTKQLENFQIRINSELKKVDNLLTNPDNIAMLDPQRIVRAATLSGRILDRGIEVIDTQINKYFEVANELQPLKGTADYELGYNSIWNTVNEEYIYPLEDTSSSYYLSVFLDYHMAGYRNADTQYAVSKLSERSQPIEYKMDEYPLSSSWKLQWKDQMGNLSPVNIGPSITTSPRGQKLGSMFISSQTELHAELQFTAQAIPAFAFLQLVYPYDPKIDANGREVPLSLVAVDTLEVNKPITTRYAIRIPDGYWQSGANTLKLTFPNAYQQPIPLHATVQVFYTQEDLEAAQPRETMIMHSGLDWKAYATVDGANTPVEVVNAGMFGITRSSIQGLTDTQTNPIWVPETPDALAQEVAFEAGFNLDTPYLEGFLDLVAPGTAAVYLNGNLVLDGIQMTTETDPFTVYPNAIDLPAGAVVQGRNVIRIVVQNTTAFRGILAEITISKAGKE